MAANLGLPSGDKGSFQVGLNYDLIVLDDFRNGTTRLNEKLRKRTTHSVLLQTNFSLSNSISVEGFIPWIRQERLIKNSGDFVYTQGIGDAVLLLKLRITRASSFRNLTVGFGSKFPTGSYIQKNNKLEHYSSVFAKIARHLCKVIKPSDDK